MSERIVRPGPPVPPFSTSGGISKYTPSAYVHAHKDGCFMPHNTGPCAVLEVDNVKQELDSMPGGYVTKDSGERQQFDTGAQRDTQNGKPRYDLIPPDPLKRVAELYERGARKYDSHNWTKGIPTSRFLASAMRHLEQYRAGERDEDHLSAVVFNLFGIMHFEGTELDDQHEW